MNEMGRVNLARHQGSGAETSLGDVLDLPKAVRKKPVAKKSTSFELETITPRNAREDRATQTVGGGERLEKHQTVAPENDSRVNMPATSVSLQGTTPSHMCT
jgi:hypothetical protein